MQIYIDGDGCLVKEETFRVAERYQLPVVVVANKWMNVPVSPLIEMKVVSQGFDAADDWIVETCAKGDIVITADILLADRCVKKGARVLGPKGEEFTEDNIGTAVSNRELMQNCGTWAKCAAAPHRWKKRTARDFSASSIKSFSR